jgi:chromate reductase
MTALFISGSSSKSSSNSTLLVAISKLDNHLQVEFASPLTTLPLYSADDDHTSVSEIVVAFRQQIRSADCVIISTPEYLHNIPAVLKNSLEWLKTGGELQRKKVIPICYTPKEPRGEKALESLVNSLLALEANVLCKIRLFHKDIRFDETGKLLPCIGKDIVTESIALL